MNYIRAIVMLDELGGTCSSEPEFDACRIAINAIKEVAMTKLKLDSCKSCQGLNFDGDYPICEYTGETKGYDFNVGKHKMDHCPFQKPNELNKSGGGLLKIVEHYTFTSIEARNARAKELAESGKLISCGCDDMGNPAVYIYKVEESI